MDSTRGGATSGAAGRGIPLHQQIVQEELAAARQMLEEVFDIARLAMRQGEDGALTRGERLTLMEAGEQLGKLGPVIAGRYPAALGGAIGRIARRQEDAGTKPLSRMQADELELMSEVQAIESAERVTAVQILSDSLDASLSDFETLFCAAQGHATASPDLNPLKPLTYLKALQEVVGQMELSDAVRKEWILPVTRAFGTKLRERYVRHARTLRQAGVQPASHMIRSAHGRHHQPVGFDSQNEFAAAVAPPAGLPPPGTGSLEPAGVPAAPSGEADAGAAERRNALSRKVVTHMVDKVVNDTRLLLPVRQFVRSLEPALLQLVATDPRFLIDKDHPAHQLLRDITDRSLAFGSAKAPGFDRFMQTLIKIAGPLAAAPVQGHEPFANALQDLHALRTKDEQASKAHQARAIKALQHAEQRNLLAAKLRRSLWLLPAIESVPTEVSRFILGPWTQVMAEARLKDTSGREDPGRYRESVNALLWSAQPDVTRQNPARLTRLLPKLIPKLREGLALIDYPASRTDAFFEQLMQLHQEAFKPAPEQLPEAPPVPEKRARRTMPRLGPDDEPWMAPAEAKDSGFMPSAPLDAADGDPPAATAGHGNASALHGLAVGSWVGLRIKGQWKRTQLTWIGRDRKLFLFTTRTGRTQSMTLRLLEQFAEDGSLRVISDRNVLDGALDDMARSAMGDDSPDTGR